MHVLGTNSGVAASASGTLAPGVYPPQGKPSLEEEAGVVRLENQSELRAPTARHAAYYLDAAVSARTVPGRGPT